MAFLISSEHYSLPLTQVPARHWFSLHSFIFSAVFLSFHSWVHSLNQSFLPIHYLFFPAHLMTTFQSHAPQMVSLLFHNSIFTSLDIMLFFHNFLTVPHTFLPPPPVTYRHFFLHTSIYTYHHSQILNLAHIFHFLPTHYHLLTTHPLILFYHQQFIYSYQH